MRSIAKVKTYTRTWVSSKQTMAANDAAGSLACVTKLQLVEEHSTDSHEPRITRSYLRISHIELGMVLMSISAYLCYIGAYSFTAYSHKRMRLTPRVYGNQQSVNVCKCIYMSCTWDTQLVSCIVLLLILHDAYSLALCSVLYSAVMVDFPG